jgi:hypothetical protein
MAAPPAASRPTNGRTTALSPHGAPSGAILVHFRTCYWTQVRC